MVNPLLAEQIYLTSELCVRYQRILMNQFINVLQLKSQFTQLHLLNFFVEISSFFRRYKRKQRGLLFFK